MTTQHYENFPVASLLLPAHLRPAVRAIYAFARSADDVADEGNASAEARLTALASYEMALDRIEHHQVPALCPALAKVVHDYRLPLQPLRDLLSAFKQDVCTTRYASFDALLDYCQRSANPVGRLMLHLYDAVHPQNLSDADAICSALQLINFWQDIALDWQKGRIYLPQESLQRFHVAETQLEAGYINEEWCKLMRFEIGRTRALMLSGAPLVHRLSGRISWELRLIVHGGLRILEKIEAVNYDVFRRRPQLGQCDWVRLIARATMQRFDNLS